MTGEVDGVANGPSRGHEPVPQHSTPRNSTATVYSRAAIGLDAALVRVEVHLCGGLPQFSIVGLPETAVRESRQRVRSALLQCNYRFPSGRITANLAPADLPKSGTRFDLAIAIGILVASSQIRGLDLKRFEFVGELGLTGALRPVASILSASLAARDAGRVICIAEEDRSEAALATGVRLVATNTLPNLIDILLDRPSAVFEPVQATAAQAEASNHADLGDVVGHALPKRALEIAAAGAHGLLMIGPPGCGKSMLAARLTGLLPAMTEQEAIDTARIYSLASMGIDLMYWRRRQFRSPHHSASAAAIIGGGRIPQPGEVSLAHNGVLFLDEMPEFGRHVLEQLREPMETGGVALSRANFRIWYPANFQLVGAMNPCPCGWYAEPGDRCHCSIERVESYRRKISGPLLDRLDLHINVNPIPPALFKSHARTKSETSADVRKRVRAARCLQIDRGVVNNRLTPDAVFDSNLMNDEARDFLAEAADRRMLSSRGHHRVFRVARTIADLAARDRVCTEDVAEALGLRCMDQAALR